MLERSAGVLMALSSLPSPYGVGGLGAPARAFVDFLAAAGQRWWQLLPVSPLGEGGSPYQSCSAFAGEPLYLDLEDLTEQGLITAEELAGQRLDSPDAAAFEEARALRMPLLRKAWRRAGSLSREEEPFWLEDYVRCVSRRAGDPEEGEFHRFLQLQFLRQWDALRDYAGARGVRLMGDIPIYLSLDSAEVQAHPELFQLDRKGRPARVAGVPPDAFSREGQLWGSPLYDWAGNPGGTAAFWRDRARWAARLYDADIHTGNEVLDVALTEKSLLCESHGIRLNCVADGACLRFLEPGDLYALFANALDPAITAASHLAQRDRAMIDLLVCTRQGFAVINLVYPLDTAPESPKAGRYELKVVRRIAQKYGGTVTAETRQEFASLKVLLPLAENTPQ